MHEELKNKCSTLEHEKQSLEESSVDKEHFSITRNDDYEQYQLSIRPDNQSGLNTLFQHLHSTANDANEWRINLSKPLHQVNSQRLRTS